MRDVDDPDRDLAFHVAKKVAGGLALPAFIDLGDGEFRHIRDVKADPRLRADFVKLLRRELKRLTEIRKQKMLLITFLNGE